MTHNNRIATGEKVPATYHESEDPMNRHNCYVEALPRILTSARVTDLMRREPAFHKSERLLPPELRLHAVQRVANYIDPVWVFLDIEQRFSRLIRNGYIARNPLSPERKKQMLAGFPKIDTGNDIPGYNPTIRSTASGFYTIGTSGVGKSTAIESVLSLYPQVIVHTEYNGQPFDQNQLVWLKLDCPHDGSVRGLCIMFFMKVDELLGTRYYNKYCANKRRTAIELLPLMASTADVLGLGVLVIDEIQRLSSAKSGGGNEMLDFFVLLVNVIGVPVVLVGTYKAYKMLSGAFAIARRGEGQGDLIWPLFGEDENWSFFLEGLWRYQWTSTPTELTKELRTVLYEESQGITDIVVKLYMLAQWSVIGEKNEQLTPEVFRSVAKESLQLAQPILTALRTGNQEILREIKDIQSPLADIDTYKANALKRVASQKNIKDKLGARPADIFQQIFNQLILAGFDEEEATACANQTIAYCGKDAGIKELLANAFRIATDKSQEKAAKIEEAPPYPKTIKRPPAENDLRTIAKGGKDGVHQALKEAGLIKSADEFLE